MWRRVRTAWPRWLALVAALAVVSASDARLTRSAVARPESTTLHAGTASKSCCKTRVSCCASEPQAVAEADACGCCRPTEPSDRPDSDSRSTLGLVKVKVDLGLTSALVSTAIDARPEATPPRRRAARSASGRPLYLLNARLIL